MQMEPKKILIGGIAAGIAILVTKFIVDNIINFLFPYNTMEIGGMRSIDDPLMMLFFLHPWVLGFAMSTAFQKFKGSFRSTGWCRGKAFGIYVWLLAGLPSAFIVYTSMNYPIGFTASSLIGSLIYMVAAGITIEKVSA